MRVFRGVAGLFGELLITLGAVLLLFVGWQLWWTDVTSDADAAQVVDSLQAGFDSPGWVQPRQVRVGDAYAIIRVPRFGASYARPLYEGTTAAVLDRGVGHYVGTAMPGEVGNFAMAGHRTTYGKPFNRIAELKKGDVVLVETGESWFVYRAVRGPRRPGGDLLARRRRPRRRPEGGLMSFYGWVWRVLPGPVPVKVVEAALLVLAVVAVLFVWVFPQVAPFMPFNNTTVGQ